MQPVPISPLPPTAPGLSWRPVGMTELEMLVDLGQACLRADGGIPFLFVPDVLQEIYFPNELGAGIGAFDLEGRLVACTTVHLRRRGEEQLAVILGMVRPDWRKRGAGEALMRWSQAQAANLFAEAMKQPEGAGQPPVIQIRSETLTEAAERLYQRHGFEKVFEELAMRIDLNQPLPEKPFPPDVTIASWEPELAEQFYQAFYAAFKERPGFPGWSAAEWIGNVTDNDFRPEWSLLARVNGAPVGFTIGNIDLTSDPPGAHIWQVGVVPAQRRRGIVSALMIESTRRMQADGVGRAMLEVHTNNPGAIEAYTRLGFQIGGRRARYERVG